MTTAAPAFTARFSDPDDFLAELASNPDLADPVRLSVNHQPMLGGALVRLTFVATAVAAGRVAVLLRLEVPLGEDLTAGGPDTEQLDARATALREHLTAGVTEAGGRVAGGILEHA